MEFHKYHGLGNDYLVIEPAQWPGRVAAEMIKRICNRNYGVGSDGILLGPNAGQTERFTLRIFNPDGSEAEKSGNGLRIFARYLHDTRRVGQDEFEIMTAGGVVCVQVMDRGGMVRVDMGSVSFDSGKIPVAGPRRDVLSEKLTAGDRQFTYCAATVGNPHCIILDAKVSEETVKRYGPMIETDVRFPNRTNVQFMEVMDRANIRIEIWERGAGYTLASGSSSSAAAAIAHRLGLCDNRITVHMPGGELLIDIGKGYAVTMTGPVVKVADGTTTDEMFW
jgi:diaminopimelate epimerase